LQYWAARIVSLDDPGRFVWCIGALYLYRHVGGQACCPLEASIIKHHFPEHLKANGDLVN